MLTPIQELKQIHYFKLIDVDKNNFIEKNDWVSIGDNLAALRGIHKNSLSYEAIQKSLDLIWDNLSTYADFNNDHRISLEEWLKFQDERVINCDDKWYNDYVNEIMKGLFSVVDANGDGVIGLDEYVHMMVSFRVEPRFAVESFYKLDSNSDGIISQEELLNALREFHKSADPDTSGNWLFGPYWRH